MNRDFQKSRALDINRICHDPKIMDLVKEVRTTLFQEDRGESIDKVLPMLLSELQLAWLEDPDSCLGLYMSQRFYKLNRYNSLKISHKVIQVVRTLAELGWIGLQKGQQSTIDEQPGRTTRIWANQPLINLFNKYPVALESFGSDSKTETIILRDSDKKEIEYEDTPETIRMRSVLTDYNRLLDRSFIDIPELDCPVIEQMNGETIRIGSYQKTVVRIFSNSSFAEHGRFYRAWWHSLPSKWRQKIHINDAPVMEDDFSSMLPTLMYAEKNHRLKKDAYSFSLAGDNPFGRKELKTIVLVAINADDEGSAIKAIRKNLRDVTNLSFTDKHIKDAINAFRSEHPLISDQLCSGIGIKLMKRDSDIAEKVIEKFTKEDTPVLSIHDSFIVPWDKEKELRTFMEQAFEEVTGVLPFDIKSEGIDWRHKIKEGLSSPTFINPNQRHYLLNAERAFQSEGYKQRRTKFYNKLRTKS